MHQGALDRASMAHAMVTDEDLRANFRATFHDDSMRDVDRVVLERNGRLTFVRESDRRRPIEAASRERQSAT
nr:YetF domain-containing protein [uncultured Cupriavidus sp.]